MWVKSVWECKKGYTKEEIYNTDKTGLFYMTLDTTFKFKGEKCVSGKKLTVLICENDWNR
jgi:hypothetical protein